MDQPTALTTISPDQLADVTGGGLLSKLGSLFGPKAAKWTGIAEQIFGLFKGGTSSSSTSATSATSAGPTGDTGASQ